MASERWKPRSISSSTQLLRLRARLNRHAATESEHALWLALRGAQFAVTFRRQVVLQGYIADFAACSVKVIVEVDGSWHRGRPVADARRDRALRAAGYRVLRFTAAAVLRNLPAVVSRIRAAVAAR